MKVRRKPKPKPKGRRYKVFVSYARADAWAAGQIAKELRSLGVEVFIDTQIIHAGDLFQTRILDALRSANEVAVLLTADSIGRTWVQQELGAAKGLDLRVVGIFHKFTWTEAMARGGLGMLSESNCIDIGQLEQYLRQVKDRMKKQ
jgi:hypothetical protein